LRTENQQLAKRIAAVPVPATPPNGVGIRPLGQWGRIGDWGHIPAIPPNDAVVGSVGPTITIDAAGMLAWNYDRINLAEFKRRLSELQASNPQTAIRIRSMRPRNSEAAKWVLDEARQAKIQNISEETLDGSWWF
jgi:hypothetical protein